MSISERFGHFLKQKRLSQKEFCKMTGYAYSSLTKLISNQTSNPGVNLFILTKKHFPELNIEWIITGEGEMWDEKVLEEKGLSHTNQNEVAGEELIFLGETTQQEAVSPIYSDLLKTKDMLIESQRDQIENLKAEIGRLNKD